MGSCSIFLMPNGVGHGLTLKNSPSLITKFLERKIGIEMRPSSNYQIKGFKDNYILESQLEDIYPLKEYLDKELRVSVTQTIQEYRVQVPRKNFLGQQD